MYDDGQEEVPQNYAQAAFWYRKAAEQGNAKAQEGLGDLYFKGLGVGQDYTQAAFWYGKAAQQGYDLAEVRIAALYVAGRGVPQDFTEAYFWLDLVTAGKPDDSNTKDIVKFRDEAASHLTPADLSRAQKRARIWFEAHQAKPH